MAFYDTTWYVNFGNGTSTGYYAVPVRPQNTAVVAGQLCRQFTTPTVGNERIWICIVAGTTANTTDATWTLTRGAKTTDGTATWQEVTGNAAVNGDLANTPTWAQAKAIGGIPNLGVIVKRNNGASYQIISTGLTFGASEPAFSDTPGVTTAEGAGAWTCLGPVTNFTGGQAPHARLANALTGTWFASGNTVYVGDNHAETQSTTLTLTANSAAMARILCHNHSGPYPPTGLMTGAKLTASGNLTLNITPQGSWYFYGLTFVGASFAGASSGTVIAVGATSVGQVQNWYYFDNCSLQQGDVNGTGFIDLGANNASAWAIIIFNNTTVKFGGVSECITPCFCQFVWQNTGPVLAAGSSIPTSLFSVKLGTPLSTVVLEGLDLSQLAGSLFANTATPSIGDFLIKDCKLNATATITQPINTGQVVQNSRSSAIAAPHVSSRHTYEAIETTETSIVRTGGFTDPTGQAQSRKIITSANSQWLRPYKAEPYAVWNSVVGSSVTATVYGLAGIGALPNNDDVWLELQYLGSGASPLGSVVTTGKANVWSSNAAVPSDGSSWSVPTFAAFSDATLVPAAVLTNNNLTITQTNTSGGAGGYSYSYAAAGKFYFEFTVVARFPTGAHTFGALTSNGVFTDLNTLNNQFSVQTSGNVISNGASVGPANLGAFAAGDVCGFAIDLNARLGWARKNNGIWNNSGAANPATGVGGLTLYPTVGYVPAAYFGTSSSAGSQFTLNCGQSAFANAAPSGFGNLPWVYTLFKLTTSFTPNLPGYILGRVRAAKPSTTFYIDPKLTVS